MILNFKTSSKRYLDRTDTIVKYLHDVRMYETLSEDTEKEIFMLLKEAKEGRDAAIEEGDRELAKLYDKEYNKVRETIISSNLRFVISVARIFANNDDLLDLIDEGNIGLIKAVDSFDTNIGVRFQTYAIWVIRQCINKYRRTDALFVRKNNESKTFHIISDATNRFIQQNQREPSSEELKDFINENYPNTDIKDSADVLTVRVSSIDEPVDSDDDGYSVADTSQYNALSASVNAYENILEHDNIRHFVDSLMKGLSERDKKIIKMHFGIDQPYNSPADANEIARATNLTPERVRQIILTYKKDMKEKYKKKIVY